MLQRMDSPSAAAWKDVKEDCDDAVLVQTAAKGCISFVHLDSVQGGGATPAGVLSTGKSSGVDPVILDLDSFDPDATSHVDDECMSDDGLLGILDVIGDEDSCEPPTPRDTVNSLCIDSDSE